MQHDEPDYRAELIAWAHSAERLHEEPLDALYAITEKLNALGLDIGLATLVIRTPHPQLDMLVLRWRPRDVSEVPTKNTTSILDKSTTIRESGVQDIFPLVHGHTNEAMWRESPFHRVLASKEPLHIPLCPPPSDSPFSIVDDLVERGMTDYAAFPLASPQQTSFALSLATQRPGGFPADFIAGFVAALAPLALSLSFKAERIQFREVLSAYIGQVPATRVLEGQLHRGDLTSQEAAIGFADLRDFSRDAETLEPEALLARLSEFFELVCKAVTDHGGEVLKFMGDGVLFIFPKESSASATCDRASQAVSELEKKVHEHTAGTNSPLRYGCALHYGSVLFGNIGAPSRLDFTVIGQAVNLTARLEALCTTTGQSCLLSEEFAALISAETQLVGDYELKGFSSTHRVYALPRSRGQKVVG